MSTPLDLIDPVELSELARLAREDFDAQSQSLARYLPYVEVDDIKYAYSRGVDDLVYEATFLAVDAESPIGRRAVAARVTGELQPISRKTPLSEYARLRLRAAEARDSGIVAGVYRD